MTIPLRPCCPNCFSATERAALQGDDWTEDFSRAARRRRSVSADNRPCPPHLDDGRATIQWSTVSEHADSTCHSIVVVDEADPEESGVTVDVASASESNEEGVSAVQRRFDRLSFEGTDGVLLPSLSHRNPWLSPIPSSNVSVDDLTRTCTATEDSEAKGSPTSCSPVSASVSPPASPLLQTPSSSSFPTPASSPTISSPPRQKGRGSSPRIPSSFRIPKRSSLMRAGSDILKGVNVLGGGGPI